MRCNTNQRPDTVSAGEFIVGTLVVADLVKSRTRDQNRRGRTWCLACDPKLQQGKLKKLRAEYGAGVKLAVERGWLWMHESGTYVKVTLEGAESFGFIEARGVAGRE
ncbi:hypothetical protein I6F35_31610 [Bradyrhizobium sp. BRP22]|uniref:hypothetical protein n=1 Tax=Bradyrhizobium sp. BRP22 TaxID=2793821 RepID=UPI001CD4E6B5|nr:hypothetical protein [Bradyrhizobium sp. BRP22]MCA1457687.1 hypothetical protein [Bradyrhizobium sp. BRP22]